MKFKLVFIFITITLLSLFAGCSSSSAINDFFGIEMPPSEVQYFKIIGYTETSGISYQSTKNMDPNIYAWAGLEGTNIRIMITNNSEAPIKLSYDADQFILIEKEGKEYILNKGDRIAYSNYDPIKPNTSIELV